MILTFAQYSILTVSYKWVTRSQLEKQTNFDHLMIDYYLVGLVNIGLIKASDGEGNENTRYQLTDTGINSLEEYERANPDLVIKRRTY